MDEKKAFDFWYAVNHTRVILLPRRHLETFGATVVHYHLVSELMDSVDQVRIRAGRLQANQPHIITPTAYSETVLDGFGEQARQYVEWLKEHDSDVRILQYGYHLKQESFSEEVVTDNVTSVIERVKDDVKAGDHPMSAVAHGVDTPWDVCLVKLFWEVIRKSAGFNIRDLERHGMFQQEGGVPKGVRGEIDAAFESASRAPSEIKALAAMLRRYGLFDEYQDRFFSLVKHSRP